MSVELTIDPHTVVSWSVCVIVEDSSPVHLVILEGSFIESSILEKHLPFPVFFAIFHIPLIGTTFTISPFMKVGSIGACLHPALFFVKLISHNNIRYRLLKRPCFAFVS